MNTRNYTVPTTFAATNRFEPALLAATPFRGVTENELDQLKNRLLTQELERAASLDANVFLRRAANEAAALVWLTPYPLLLLPALFEEKAQLARRKAGKQASIRERSSGLLALAE